MMKKKQKIEQSIDQIMETEENHAICTSSNEDENEDEEDSESRNESDNEDELMTDDVENAEVLDFDFEALPLHENDKEGIINMLTQIFLRADVDVEAMARVMIMRSPLGCVYLPAEDNADEGNENVVYGLLSILPLGIKKKYENDVWSLLIARAKKYAVDKKIVSSLESLSTDGDARVVLLINERMLHFPAAIAKPAFRELLSDLARDEKANDFTHVIIIMKIRIADDGDKNADSKKKGKRKLGKAAKKRLRAAALANAEIIFDNPEEGLLFQDKKEIEFYQYPVQSDVEKDSKFNVTTIHGITFRPYRRVCLINRDIFDRFVEAVSTG